MTRYLINSFFLMLISPMLAIYKGLTINYYPIQRGVLILGITFYGTTISISSGNDGARHLNNVYNRYINMPFSQFIDESFNILTFEFVDGTKSDLYIHTLSYFVGSILQMPELFFVFVSLIYAYFFSGSILKVIRLLPSSYPSYLFYIFATIFVLYKNVEGINTVRTWTGLWVLFYGAMNYFETNRRKYLFLCFVPPFIHLGYFVMAIPAWIVLLSRNRLKWVFVIVYFLSFFTTLPQTQILEASQSNEIAAARVQGYYVDDIEQFDSNKVKDDMTFYRKAQKQGIQNYGIHLLLISSILVGLYFQYMNKVESGLFAIGMLMMTLSNWTSFLFALNARTATIGGVFVLASLVLLLKRGYFHSSQRKLNRLFFVILNVSVVFFVPYVIYQISSLLFFISIFMLALPFIPWFTQDFNISIREIFGWFLK